MPTRAPKPGRRQAAVGIDARDNRGGPGWPPGLCGSCVHARRLVTARQSRFLFCELSRTDPRFPRYPNLPVLACDGFEGGIVAPETIANRP